MVTPGVIRRERGQSRGFGRKLVGLIAEWPDRRQWIQQRVGEQWFGRFTKQRLAEQQVPERVERRAEQWLAELLLAEQWLGEQRLKQRLKQRLERRIERRIKRLAEQWLERRNELRTGEWLRSLNHGRPGQPRPLVTPGRYPESEGVRGVRYRRQPIGCASVFLLVFFIFMVPASFQTGQWWLGLLIAGVLVVGLAGKLRERRPTPTHRQPIVRQVVQAPRRTFYRARCDHCGAPRAHGAEACRYCGRSLQVG
jgi:hypothetical protein